jgi:hypothetical protein
MPGNRIPGASSSPRVLLQRAAVAQVQAASTAAVVAPAVTALEAVTSGLDVGGINDGLADLDARVAALEGP